MKAFYLFYFFIILTFFCKEKTDNNQTDVARSLGEVVVIFTVGDVKVGKDLAKPGEKIQEGSEIKVGNKSLAELQFVNKATEAVVRINQNSIFVLNKKNMENPKQELVSVNQGEVHFDVKKAKSDEELMILTPSSAAGVRGTKFVVSVSKQNVSKIEVIEGSVSMAPMSSELNKLPRILVETNPTLKDTEEFFKSSEIILEKGQKGTITGTEVDKYLKASGVSQILSSKEITEAANREKLDDAEIKKLNQLIESKSNKELETKAREKKIKVQQDKISEKEMQRREKEYETLLKLEIEKINESSLQENVVKLNSDKNKKVLIKKIETIFGKDSQILILNNGSEIEGVIESEEIGDIKIYTTEGLKTFKRTEVEGVK